MAKRDRKRQHSVNLNRTVPLLAIIFICAAVFLFFLVQLIQGGAPAIEEEAGGDTQVIINPQDMTVGKTRPAILYFRYADSSYLAKEVRDITTRPNERMEEAVLRELMAGPQDSSANLMGLFPDGAKVEKIEAQGQMLYVTFNKELLLRERADVNLQESNRRLMLMTQSIVNTILDLGNYSSVQILIDEKGDGIGEALPAKLFGMDIQTPLGEEPLSALNYNQDVVLLPEAVLETIIAAINDKNWTVLYRFTLAEDPDGGTRPSFSAAREKWQALHCGIDRREVRNTTNGPNESYVILRTYMQGEMQGSAFEHEAFPVVLYPQQSIWVISYDNLLKMMGERME